MIINGIQHGGCVVADFLSPSRFWDIQKQREELLLIDVEEIVKFLLLDGYRGSMSVALV